jgi:nitrogenase molybdenum-iron protein NifN
VGPSLAGSAEALLRRFGTPYTVVGGLGSLRDTDRFLHALATISCAEVPARLRRQRAVLVDALRDAHASTAGRTASLALECDLAAQVTPLLAEMGLDVPVAVVPVRGPATDRIVARRVAVGDLSDLAAADVVIGSSHAASSAARLGVPHYALGFPLHGVMGAAHQLTVGYAGARAVAEGIAQVLFDAHAHVASDLETRSTR